MSTIIDDYLREADQWGKAMAEGDSTRANAIFDQVQNAHAALVATGEVDALFDRADDSSDCARFYIASHMKTRDIARAIAIYEQLQNSSLPFVALSSRYILEDLKKDAMG